MGNQLHNPLVKRVILLKSLSVVVYSKLLILSKQLDVMPLLYVVITVPTIHLVLTNHHLYACYGSQYKVVNGMMHSE